MADEPEEKKPEQEPINLKVVTQDGNEIYFKCKMTTPLQKLMNAFCNRFGCAAQAHSQGIPFAALRFLANGNRLHDGVTPRELELVDGDTIEVLPNYPSGSGPP